MMTATLELTSQRISDLAAKLPSLARDAGLLVIKATYGPPDVFLDQEASLEVAVQVAAATGAAFISPEVKRFSASDLLGQLDSAEYGLTEAVEKVVERAAKKYAREKYYFSLTWVGQGVVYCWDISTDWYAKLSDQVQRMEQDWAIREREEQLANQKASEEIVARLGESAEFKGAPPMKRQSVGRAIASGWFPDVARSVVSDAVSEAARPMDGSEMSFMREYRDKVDVLCQELIQMPEWLSATQDEARQAVAQDMLRDLSGGYGINLTFVRSLVSAAKKAGLKKA